MPNPPRKILSTLLNVPSSISSRFIDDFSDSPESLNWANLDGNYEIYVMDADGGNEQNLTNNRRHDTDPAWYTPPFAVTPAGKKFTMWGWLKQVD
ncbi:hypothetical protein F4X33_21120 [Candidatus Poribacteria bacterium]|nr:hypothetical protein [Candidatus Poribacteria bacterium]